jgi:hypothetical protein
MTRALVALLVLAAPGCLFVPDVQSHGYTRCSDDSECAAGRACAAGLCAPPRWNDARFERRQLIVVDNRAEEPLRAGMALPLRIGAEGLLASAAFGVDGRFTYFSFKDDAWREVPTWRDIYGGHLFAWLPLQEDVPAGRKAPLVWVESLTGEREPNLREDVGRVFPLLFEELEEQALFADGRWRFFGTGGAPLHGEGRVVVADNQKLVLRTRLAPPFSLTARGRINGVTCQQVYVGLTASDGVSFEPPSVGFWMNNGLEAQLEVAPQEVSEPRYVGSAQLDTAMRRYRIDVGDQSVRWALDDEVLGEPEGLRFLGEELFFRVEVGGACSFELDTLWVTPLPFVHPTLRAEPVVEYRIFE